MAKASGGGVEAVHSAPPTPPHSLTLRGAAEPPVRAPDPAHTRGWLSQTRGPGGAVGGLGAHGGCFSPVHGSRRAGRGPGPGLVRDGRHPVLQVRAGPQPQPQPHSLAWPDVAAFRTPALGRDIAFPHPGQESWGDPSSLTWAD